MTRKTWKWWIKLVFFHLFNLAVSNAYINYKKVVRSPVSHFQFRYELIRYVLDSDVQRNSGGRKRSVEDNNKHFPERIPGQPDAKVRIPTRKCVVCHMIIRKWAIPGVNSKRKETPYWCGNCEKPLCC